MFVVQLLKEKIGVELNTISLNNFPEKDKPTLVPLSFADGMVGALPVFDTYENALAYAKYEYLILEIKGVENERSDS